MDMANKAGVRFLSKLWLGGYTNVVTIPKEIVQKQGWEIGDVFEVRLVRVKKKKRGK